MAFPVQYEDTARRGFLFDLGLPGMLAYGRILYANTTLFW